ncbi:DUF1045 domain-containing protein [Gordonia sp. 135]|jgi:hypothetical protein|uniref:DUF1045 domain-containing protein n=1 Tax=Gordonia sp. 135 TaxID=2676309 RepID=UPI0012BB206D|nr:DUF1045 domain-containing protein [Gordonia sp. 135]QGP87875.1 DUF1045 domain-containing protein [Gordonia sp. 135]
MTVWRAAVYAAPGFGPTSSPAGAHATRLRGHAEEWLGRAVDGRDVPRRTPAGWTRDEVDAITVAARSYGFHGTLKPPFHLTPGRSLDELVRAVDHLAARTPAASVPRLRLGRLGSFFALVPGADDAPLRSVADAVVTELDAFRAPLTDHDRARRNPDALTERQRDLLDYWGYPYVLDEFRFHLTLTDRIPDARQSVVSDVLESWFGDVLGQDIPLDALTVFTQATPDAPFLLHSVHPMEVCALLPPRAPGTSTMEGITR